ncbi:MAG: hypothetical protein OXH31_06595 [Gammaproteobacteria bacterium]|nr:hypothetical protein [Gammaproteobacteria bacterium]
MTKIAAAEVMFPKVPGRNDCQIRQEAIELCEWPHQEESSSGTVLDVRWAAYALLVATYLHSLAV